MPDSYQGRIDNIENFLDSQPFEVLTTVQDIDRENYRFTICGLFRRCLRPCCLDLESTISSILTEASLHTTSTDLLQELFNLAPSIPPCQCLALVNSNTKKVCPLLLLPREYLI